MRTTVYAEELRLDRKAQLICTPVRDEPGKTYDGVRIVVGPNVIHHGDDDSSAITFYAPKDSSGRTVTKPLRMVLEDMLKRLDELDATLQRARR